MRIAKTYIETDIYRGHKHTVKGTGTREDEDWGRGIALITILPAL